MKRISLFILFTLTLVTLACQQSDKTNTSAGIDLKPAMERFHSVLRPLQHQAVPEQDIAMIRANTDTLLILAEQVKDAKIPEELAAQSNAIKLHQETLLKSVQALTAAAKTNSAENIMSAFSDIHSQYESFADVIYTLQGTQ